MSAPGSVLANLTAQMMATTTMGEKKAAARKLTPVKGEVAEAPAPSFPSDLPGAFMSKEGLRDAAKDLRRHAATLVETADALDALSQMPTAPREDVHGAMAADQKARERAADEARASEPSFAEKFAAMQAEAQAHVYDRVVAAHTNPLAELTKQIIAEDRAVAEVLTAVVEASAWTCPVHGAVGVQKTSAKTMKVFIGCPECKEFQR